MRAAWRRTRWRARLQDVTASLSYRSNEVRSDKQEVQNHERVLMSAIQPSGVPHVGNYFGALCKWWLPMNGTETQPQHDAQEQAMNGYPKSFFAVADLHALTTKGFLSGANESNKTAASILATRDVASERGQGVDACVFVQSHVPAHVELYWYLSSCVPVSWLTRLTQWKEKKLEQQNKSKQRGNDGNEHGGPAAALLTYPILQAADIIIHGATHVPVGEDQLQHIELTRTCTRLLISEWRRKWKSEEGSYPPWESIPIRTPEAVVPPANSGARIKSLTDPTQKMSKSAPSHRSRIVLTDDAVTIRKKIRAAVTDHVDGPITLDPVARPGVSNLLRLWAATLEATHQTVPPSTAECTTTPAMAMVLEECKTLTRHVQLKDAVADALVHHLAPITERINWYLHTPEGTDTLNSHLAQGAKEATASAERTMKGIRWLFGCGPNHDTS